MTYFFHFFLFINISKPNIDETFDFERTQSNTKDSHDELLDVEYMKCCLLFLLINMMLELDVVSFYTNWIENYVIETCLSVNGLKRVSGLLTLCCWMWAHLSSLLLVSHLKKKRMFILLTCMLFHVKNMDLFALHRSISKSWTISLSLFNRIKLCLLFRDFECKVMRWLVITPSLLHPNSWAYVICFEFVPAH